MNKPQVLSESKLTNTSFDFSYTWSDGTTIVGTVDGKLQPDKNTVKNLSHLRAFIKNSDGVVLAEVFNIITLLDLIQLTLDGSSLEFDFANSKGDKVQFFSTTSNLLFDTSLIIHSTSLIIDQITVIPFETINPAHWEMYQKITY